MEKYRHRLLKIDEKIAKLYSLRLKLTKETANCELRNGIKIIKKTKAQAFDRASYTCPDLEFIEYHYNLFDRIYKDDNDLRFRIKKLKKLK